MKKLLAVLLVLSLILSLGAVAFAAEDGKITIWTWDPKFNIAAMNIAADMYHVDHPDVEIEVQEVLSDDIEQNVATAAAAGIPPMPESARVAIFCVDSEPVRMSLPASTTAPSVTFTWASA